MNDKVSPQTISQSVRWVALVKLISQLATFLTTVIVLAYLTREDFGLASMAFIVMGVLDVVIDFGFSAALVQRKEVTENEFSACFWAILAVSVLSILLIFLEGEIFGWLFDDDRVILLIQVLSLIFLVTPVHVVSRARLTREFRLDYLAKCDLLGLLLRSGLSVAAVMFGMGVWSLIIGFVAEKMFVALLLLVGGSWLPRAQVDFRPVWPLLQFGLKITLDRVVYALLYRVDAIIVGRLLGAEALGLYSLAQQFVSALVQLVMTTGVKVAYPLFSAYQSSGRLLPTFYRAERLIMLFAFAALCGLALVAEDLLKVLMDPRWGEAAIIIQVLALAGGFQVTAGLMPQLLNALDRSGLNLMVNTLSLLFSAVLLYLAVTWWGQRGLLVSLVLLALVRYLLVLAATRHALPTLQVYTLLRNLVQVSVCTLCMAGGVIVIQALMTEVIPVWRLVLAIAVGMATYVLAHLLLFRAETLNTYRLLRAS